MKIILLKWLKMISCKMLYIKPILQARLNINFMNNILLYILKSEACKKMIICWIILFNHNVIITRDRTNLELKLWANYHIKMGNAVRILWAYILAHNSLIMDFFLLIIKIRILKYLEEILYFKIRFRIDLRYKEDIWRDHLVILI